MTSFNSISQDFSTSTRRHHPYQLSHTSPKHLLSLPGDILILLTNFLSIRDLLRLSWTCKALWIPNPFGILPAKIWQVRATHEFHVQKLPMGIYDSWREYLLRDLLPYRSPPAPIHASRWPCHFCQISPGNDALRLQLLGTGEYIPKGWAFHLLTLKEEASHPQEALEENYTITDGSNRIRSCRLMPFYSNSNSWMAKRVKLCCPRCFEHHPSLGHPILRDIVIPRCRLCDSYSGPVARVRYNHDPSSYCQQCRYILAQRQ